MLNRIQNGIYQKVAANEIECNTVDVFKELNTSKINVSNLLTANEIKVSKKLTTKDANVFNLLTANEAQVSKFINTAPLLNIPPTQDDHIVTKKYVNEISNSLNILLDKISNSIKEEVNRAIISEGNISESFDNLNQYVTNSTSPIYNEVSEKILKSVLVNLSTWMSGTSVLQTLEDGIKGEISRAIESESSIRSKINFYYIMQDVSSSFFSIKSKPIAMQTGQLKIGTDGWFFKGSSETPGGFEIASNFEKLVFNDINFCACLVCFPEAAVFSSFSIFLHIGADMYASYRIPLGSLSTLKKNIPLVFFIGNNCPVFRAPGGMQPLPICLELFDISTTIGLDTLKTTTPITSIGINWGSDIIITQVVIGSANGTEVFLFSNDTVRLNETKHRVDELYQYFFDE